MFAKYRERVVRVVSLVSEIAEMLIFLREKPRAIDYFAIGTKSFSIACKICDEFMDCGEDFYAYDYFVGTSHLKSAETWRPLPPSFIKCVENSIVNKRTISRIRNMPNGVEVVSSHAWLADLSGFKVGVITKGEKGRVEAMFVQSDDFEEIKLVVADHFWSKVGGNFLTIVDEEITLDLNKNEFVCSNLVNDTKCLVKSYLDAGINNNYVIVGEPGTGKTCAVKEIVSSLGLRVLRLPLGVLSGNNLRRADEQFSLEAFCEIARPEVIIIDDLDRAPTYIQNQMLDFIDNHSTNVKILIATVNNMKKLIAPLRRPGRFSEHIHVPPLELEFIEGLLGEQKHVAHLMLDWNVAFVTQFVRMVGALGSEKAIAGIPSLDKRLAYSREEFLDD